MYHNTRLWTASLFLLVLVAGLLATVVVGQEPQRRNALGTAFTYQGHLDDAGTSANGNYDLRFILYDAEVGGAQVGSTVSVDNVAVTDGLFTVQLDFGSAVFDGNSRYLEIAVRPADSTGGYATLSPRQALTPTPYAVYTSYAESAPWSGLQGVPAGFADGEDDSNTYTAGAGLKLEANEFSAKGSGYENVIIVAKSGGDFTSIQDALDNITDASTDNRYLLWVGPGTYEEVVTMKSYVDVEGAGEQLTKIMAGGGDHQSGTLFGADDAELRFLTVENVGSEGLQYATAIRNNGTSPRLLHVTAIASGASGGNTYNVGIYNSSGGAPLLKHVTAMVSGTAHTCRAIYNVSAAVEMHEIHAEASCENIALNTNNFAIYNDSAHDTSMNNVRAIARNGSFVTGVYNSGGSKILITMSNVNATAYSENSNSDSKGVANIGAGDVRMYDVIAIAYGTKEGTGVYNAYGRTTLNNVTAHGSGGTNAYGVFNLSAGGTTSVVTALISNSTISGTDASVGNYGVYNRTSNINGELSLVRVNHSDISGATSTVRNQHSFMTQVGGSWLNGGSVVTDGVMLCATVYDEYYTFFDTTCP